MKTMKNSKFINVVKSAKSAVNRFIQNNSGDGYIDVIMKILIAVVIGAALLGAMKVAMPKLFNDMLEKVRSLLVI